MPAHSTPVRRVSLTLCALVGLLLSACAPALQGDGVATVLERPLGRFSSLEVSGPIAVEVEVDAAQAPGMHLEGDENLVSHVTWAQDGEALRIDARGLSPVVPLRLVLRTHSLQEVESDAGAHVVVGKVEGARVTLKTHGAARLLARVVDCDALLLEASGGARVEARGEARLVEARATASSEVMAAEVDAQVAVVTAEGASTIHVYAREQVRGRSFGGSEVRVHGAPADFDVTGQS